MISKIQLAESVRKKKELYKACLRNGYVMPSMKSTICTIDFMFEVKATKIYCPTVAQVRGRRACPDPPDVESLKQFIVVAVAQADYAGRLANIERMAFDTLRERLRKKYANKEWLIDLLWCLDNNHMIFDKNYKYRRPKDYTADYQKLIPNENQFFEGLPELTLEERAMSRR